MHGQWPRIETETLPWERDPNELRYLSRTARAKIGTTYEAAVPFAIADRDVRLPKETGERVAELTSGLVRYDAERRSKPYSLPALLLRSESAASSQIENLTAGVKNAALAELSPSAPSNAKKVAGNVAAMRKALQVGAREDLRTEDILDIHKALIDGGGQDFGGLLRSEQVWVGGSAYSPHGAIYVPPAAQRVEGLLQDLVAYAARRDVPPVVHAAVVHAQMETIHPFIDGNGRTGRALLHVMLRRDGVLQETSLPVSAGLLHNIEAYMVSLTEFQEGNPVAVVEQVADALEAAMVIGLRVESQIDDVLEGWRGSISDRSDSALWRLPALLVEQPVVNCAYVARRLGISERTASTVVAKACDIGILVPMGDKKRGIFYQAPEIVEILDAASAAPQMRRIPAKKRAL